MFKHRRCFVCNTRIWPWHFLYKACKPIIGISRIVVCDDPCYMVLFNAYEEGLDIHSFFQGIEAL